MRLSYKLRITPYVSVYLVRKEVFVIYFMFCLVRNRIEAKVSSKTMGFLQ